MCANSPHAGCACWMGHVRSVDLAGFKKLFPGVKYNVPTSGIEACSGMNARIILRGFGLRGFQGNPSINNTIVNRNTDNV